MNSSLWSADRNTHIKIVAVSLVAAIVVVTVALTTRIDGPSTATARLQADGPVVVKAGKLKTITANDSVKVQ
jgi:hypothetical protein